MKTLNKQEILKLVHAGKCNIEASDFGIENNAAVVFAGNNLELITIDDIKVDEEGVYISSDKITEQFTKEWVNYQGAGCLSIELWEAE